MAKSFKDVVKGKNFSKVSLLVYGEAGAGKSTLGSMFSHPIFLGTEVPSHLDNAEVFPRIKSMEDFDGYSKLLRDEKHDYRTLVIDTLDGLQELYVHEAFYSAQGRKPITPNNYDGGWGKGNDLIKRRFSLWMHDYFHPITEKMNVIFLCHDSSRTAEDSDGTEYNLRCPNLRPKMYNLFVDQMDAVFHVSMDKVKSGHAARSIITTGNKFTVAKNRWDLRPLYSFNREDTVHTILKDILKHYDQPKKEATNE